MSEIGPIAGGSTPTKFGCASGKPIRPPPTAGVDHTGRRCFSASAIAASQPPLASTSGPATSTGLVAAASASAAACRAARSGDIRPVTVRRIALAARSESASASQSSIGIETNTGPRGGSDAIWIARPIAVGTSWGRGGSWLYLT